MNPEKLRHDFLYTALVDKGKEMLRTLPASADYEIVSETHHGQLTRVWYWRNQTSRQKSQAFDLEVNAVTDLIDHLKDEFSRHRFLKKANPLRARNRRRWTKHNPRR